MGENKKQEKDLTPILVEDLGLEYPTKTSKYKKRYGIFKCQYCGKEFKASQGDVKQGRTKSCGCLHGGKVTHGLRYHKHYDTWKSMMQRCYNKKVPNYSKYGGRGITVCEEWHDTKTFIEWAEETYIEGMTLDRIDNDLGYYPNNCRWADKTLQSINQRKSKSNTSGYVGVSYMKKDKVWRARISFKNKEIHIGCFMDKMEAVKARDNYIIENNLPHKLSTDY